MRVSRLGVSAFCFSFSGRGTFDERKELVVSWAAFISILVEALCATPPEALAHSPSQTPLSCPVVPPSQRELHKDGGGGGGGGGVVRRARAAWASKTKSRAEFCGKSFAAPSATPCAAFFTRTSFACRPRAERGAACVCWAWAPPLEDGACHDEHLTLPSFAAPSTSSATSCATSFTCGVQSKFLSL